MRWVISSSDAVTSMPVTVRHCVWTTCPLQQEVTPLTKLSLNPHPMEQHLSDELQVAEGSEEEGKREKEWKCTKLTFAPTTALVLSA